MNHERIAERLAAELAGEIRIEATQPGIICAVVEPQHLLDVVQHLRDKFAARFVTSAGMDKREITGSYEVANIFGLDAEKIFLVLQTAVDAGCPEIPSFTPLIPGANWAEREVRDMLGIDPTGHPDPRRLILPDDWPEGVHPLRKDFRFDEKPPVNHGARPDLHLPPEGSSMLPIGPFFPTLEEPTFLNLFVEGEKIVGMDYRGFFNHRGVEKLADAVLTYNQVPFLAERICGI